MPVQTVAAAATLIDSGRLDGREMAVAGYVYWPDDWCSTVFYPGFLETNCDDPELLGALNDNNAPYLHISFTPEGRGQLLLPRQTQRIPVVVVGRTADVRYWQCTDGTRDRCRTKFAIDRVAWLDGHVVSLVPASLDPAVSWIPPETTSAGVVLAEDASAAGSLGTYDPRLNGRTGGTKWFTRVATGPADELGTVASGEQVYDDDGRDLEETLPSTWGGDYDPVRLNLANKFDESVPEYMTCCTMAFMDVSQVNGDPLTSLRETYQSGPVLLPVGDYIVTAYLAEPDGGNASAYQHCETKISIPADWTENVLAKFSGEACTVAENYF